MKYNKIALKAEIDRCFLCNDAQCTKACPNGIDAGRVIRALRFENELGAKAHLPENINCENCSECEKVCNRGKIDRNVEISKIMQMVFEYDETKQAEVDLTTDLCGVKCENPFFLSSSVVASNYKMIAKAFDMGWAGVAFKTIGAFVPKEVSPRFDNLKKEGKSFIGFKNIEQISDYTLQENVDFIKLLKKNYPTKIILASILGRDDEEWTMLARAMEEAGADVIECNFSCPHMTDKCLGSDVGTEPLLVEQFTKATRIGTKLPILAKMTPNITNMEIPAIAAVNAGADGIAAINTIKSIVNVDPDTFVTGPMVRGKSSVGGYSGKAIKPIALRFIRDMKANENLKDIPISGMGGIETWHDAFEFIAMGCSTIQVTTAVMQYGYRIIDDLIDGLSRYMKMHGYKKIDEFIGKALENIVPMDELDYDTICYPKFDREKCVECGRCYISCYDGGHQAIYMDETGKPKLKPKSCVGCQLCSAVCPVSAISLGSAKR